MTAACGQLPRPVGPTRQTRHPGGLVAATDGGGVAALGEWNPRRSRRSVARRNRRSATASGDPERGSGTVEFAVVLVTMVVPLVVAIVTMAAVQRAILGTSSAAREAGRAFVTARSGADADARAVASAREVLANHGLTESGRTAVRVVSRCRGSCRDGFGRGAEVRVEVTYRVAVLGPLAPVLGADLPVRAVHRARVDPYRGL